MRDRVRTLRNAQLLEDVPEGELGCVASLVRSVELGCAETFAVRGQPSPGMVIVEAGNLEVLLDSSPVCSLSPGSLFAEDALLSECAAPATLRAASRAQVGVLERSRLLLELPHLPVLRQNLEAAYRRRVLAARLYSIDLFRGLSPQARFRLADLFDAIVVPAGTLLAKEGCPGDAFYVIREGCALLHLESLPGEQPVLRTATLGAGDYLGDGSLLEDAPHTATVSAPRDLTVMKLDRPGFHAALSGLPGQLEEVMAAQARRRESIL